MKNIHILPTDKPSRLFLKENTILLNNQYTLQEIFSKGKCQNIYITNNQEIKKGDYVFNILSREVYPIFELWEVVSYEKKIILTTDQELIKDGVQPIDDEFLEWFVKNPSCEEVKLEVDLSKHNGKFQTKYGYKIIIPKEEHKLYSQDECQECGISYDDFISESKYQKAISEIKNAMERWHLGRDEDEETLEEINNILFGLGLLSFFNKK